MAKILNNSDFRLGAQLPSIGVPIVSLLVRGRGTWKHNIAQACIENILFMADISIANAPP